MQFDSKPSVVYTVHAALWMLLSSKEQLALALSVEARRAPALQLSPSVCPSVSLAVISLMRGAVGCIAAPRPAVAGRPSTLTCRLASLSSSSRPTSEQNVLVRRGRPVHLPPTDTPPADIHQTAPAPHTHSRLAHSDPDIY